MVQILGSEVYSPAAGVKEMTEEMLEQRLTECGIPFSPDLPGKLLKYHELLLEWNAKMDLTAVTEEADMIDRHYVDSLMALTIPELIPQGASLIDVGTGAGFPGLPLALARADLRVTLMDAQQKRLNFLQAVLDALNVENVTLGSRPRGGRRAHEGAPRVLRRGGRAGGCAAAGAGGISAAICEGRRESRLLEGPCCAG